MDNKEKLLNELEKYEEERIIVNKKANRMTIIAVLLIIGAVLLFFLEPIIGMILLLIGMGVLIFGQAPKRKFAQSIKTNVIKDIVKAELGDTATYDMNSHVDIAEIISLNMLKRPDRQAGEDLITGVYENVHYQMSDLVFQERQVRSNGKTTTVTYVTYFKGKALIFDYPGDINKTLKVFENGGLSWGNKLVKIETESIEFNKKFKVYASSKEDGFYILTPQLILKMLELEKMHRGTIYYAFENGKLYVLINDNSNSLEINVNKKFDIKFAQNIINDIILAPAIIKEFGLDKQKYQK